MQKYCKSIAATIVEDASESSAINVSSFKFVGVEFPTAAVGLASSTVWGFLKGSDTSDGDFRTLTYDGSANIISASAGDELATVAMFVPNYIKVCLSANTATAAGYGCKVHCFY